MVFFLLFIVAPIAELYVFVQVSNAIGFLNALGLVIAVALVGAWLVKHEGIKVWQRFTQQVEAGKVPSREIADGVCLLAAGVLLLAPGFLTDIVGVLLLFPPTRAIARSWLLKRYGVGGRGKVRVIKATYGGRVTDVSNVTDVTGVTEVRGELEP